MLRKLLCASLLLLGMTLAAFALHAADETKPKPKTSPWKSEDVIFAESANQARISPDGKWVVWAKSAGDKEKDSRGSNLILSSLTDGKEIQLTRGADRNFAAQWSPDGEWLAFLSSKPRPGAKNPDAASTQIWLINPHGGEAYPLTELARAPQNIQWLDKDTLVFSAEEDPSAYEQALKKKKDDSEIVDDAEHEPPVRLFKIDVKDKKITRLTNNTDWIDNFAVSPDGKFAVAAHARSLHYTFDQKVPPVTILHNLTDGTEKLIFNEGRMPTQGYSWAPDNSGFYTIVPYSNDPKFLTATANHLYFYDLAAGKPIQVPLDWENGVSHNIEATPEGVLALLAAGYRYEPARYTREKSGDTWSWKRASLDGEHARNFDSFAVSKDGKTLVYESSTASKMPQLFRAQLDGNKIASPVQLTKLNENLTNSREFAKTEVIRWKGSNGEEVEGILYYPTKYEAGKKYPIITAIHGGPTGWDRDAWDESWAYPINLLTQRGAFVLRPNYHGSGNYGLKWAESICCGKYYDLETPDINMGVDYLIAKGLVDPDKIATMGWSNGSILSTSLITNYPDRYKVASVGAGDVEWISDWGNVAFGDSFDSYYFGKSPWEDPELYIRKSPVFKLDKVKAPVLIFHGSADNNVPTSQSWTYFRVLQNLNKVPVKFVLFPGEPHGPRKLSHQLRKVDDELAWFDEYFFKTTNPANEALKAGSPLEAAIKTKDVAHSGALLGTAFNNKGKSVAIPEVVKHGDLELGRYEITRGQYAAFDKNYKIEPGTENFPANGISFDQAKAYADWLSKLTGQTWRIAGEAEVAALYESKDGENTLDYWAGYAPNPDDTAKLRKKVVELGAGAPLLKQVGTFPGQGSADEALVFDLGGNVAEWVTLKDGTGKAMGGSADCPSDARSACTPGPEYIGLRVVRGAAKP